MSKINHLKISYWNANGISQHTNEIQQFVDQNDIDVFLINETHLTDKNNFKIQGYDFYDTKHPEGTPRGGAAVLVKRSLPHYLWGRHSTSNMQACSICIECKNEKIVLSAYYSSPNNHPSIEDYKNFFASQGHRFIVAGDFNAKHTFWGSRLITTRGRVLHKVIGDCGYDISSCGEPTHWPEDPNRLPDLIDFAVTRNINRSRITSRLSLDLSSDHSPVLLEYHIDKEVSQLSYNLTSLSTNWLNYKSYISLHMVPTSPRDATEIDNAVDEFTRILKEAAQMATPKPKQRTTTIISSSQVKQAVARKRQLRRKWQSTRSPTAKANYRAAVRQLKLLLSEERQEKFATYLEGLTPRAETNHSLWKATKGFKRPQIKIPPSVNLVANGRGAMRKRLLYFPAT